MDSSISIFPAAHSYPKRSWVPPHITFAHRWHCLKSSIEWLSMFIFPYTGCPIKTGPQSAQVVLVQKTKYIRYTLFHDTVWWKSFSSFSHNFSKSRTLWWRVNIQWETNFLFFQAYTVKVFNYVGAFFANCQCPPLSQSLNFVNQFLLCLLKRKKKKKRKEK